MTPVAVGLSVREPWMDELLRLPRHALDVIEIMVDRALAGGRRLRRYRKLSRRFPVIVHGVYLGVGDADGVDAAYLDGVVRMCRELGARWYGEHLCFLNGDGVPLEHFGPLDDDPDTLAVLAANAADVRARCRVPFLLENPADVLGFVPGAPQEQSPTSRAEALGGAFRRSVEAADSGALLDLTNLVYGARNDTLHLPTYFDALPWERVVQVHLAGGRHVRGLWIDSHDRPVDDEALALLEEVCERAPNLRAVIVEWDEDLPELSGAMAEVARAREVVRGAGR